MKLIEKIATIIIATLGIFSYGLIRGKNLQKTKQLEENFEDAVKSKKRQQARKSDNISIVKRRMQKYVRK